MAKRKKEITEEAKANAELQIKEQQKETKYDLRDFTIDYIVQEFRNDLFFIPDYQREFIWPEKHRVDFIESVLLGLPIPMMFVADLDDGRLEIVDGAQRIQTLEQFRNGDLTLKSLKILTALDDFTYYDLSPSQQRKFNTKALRMVILEDSTSESRRQEIFHRINTGSVKARPSEIRRGNYDSPFLQFIIECSKNEKFIELCPVSKGLANRREREELTLRFFAYSNSYKEFKHDVGNFLDKYLSKNEDNFDHATLKTEFERMVEFVDRYFPAGFAKTKNSKSTPRVRFEAIAVGTNLALRENPHLVPKNMNWLNSEEFQKHTTTHASNSGPKLRGRVEYVKEQLLKD
ncbi:DUF262 domain-containing protein [Microbulbifer rhizosphaerae]|uniref:Uncharacterized protein with ParB-like and HNH nuclease domain n=1 Tax=Microbulbifer rhizosphaerae TaxID=1562603 RepID=A0A7W4W9W0_9GAMM|nr:DUF262 domain-containing protein [Microbulbifer rhizosphaerae]MBB3060345.1 uncharacterized protein with ParB-like and HNH nuclease domain [Microbulbifer rhizosphaerae]